MNQTDAVQLGTTDRRGLIKLAAAGSAAIAGVPLGRALAAQTPDDVRFNAVAGLPQPPLPNYATHRVEGSVNLQSGTGMITSRVVAGHPGAAGAIGIPGLTRVIRITDVKATGQRLDMRGVIEDRSQLHRGEAANVRIQVDQASGVMTAPFLGKQTELRLER